MNYKPFIWKNFKQHDLLKKATLPNYIVSDGEWIDDGNC